MDLQENFSLKGSLTIMLIGPNGEVKDKRFIPNLVVTVGKQFVASRMVGTTSAVMSHMAIGTGSTAPAVGDTTLNTEVGRVALSSASATLADVNYTATFGPGVGTGAIVEAAILNAASVGTMLCRTTFPVVNKAVGDTVAIAWTVTAS